MCFGGNGIPGYEINFARPSYIVRSPKKPILPESSQINSPQKTPEEHTDSPARCRTGALSVQNPALHQFTYSSEINQILKP